jgi:regulator of ribonuclease activity A
MIVVEIQTADICDAHSGRVQVAESIFTRYGLKRSFHGPIYTVKVFEDNVLVKKALESIPKESVLVVDGGGSLNCALMGDNLAEIAVSRQLAGVIIFGCIRDSTKINQMDIAIRALGTNPLRSLKQGKGQENIAVQFAGINFEPGSYLYADEDGLLVSALKLV